ncbi:MAG: Trk family potassium uptake protein [Clostridium sp.]|nr:Trk family potassium uptake protein [Clostridium sp.]MCM1547259.1 Trk family potassium uptake protein [Ruminococcus sp.]
MKTKIKNSITYPKTVALGFLILIAVGTILLMLPAASRGSGSADFTEALFTSTSASCVTGLVVADTYSNWTLFGQIVIICLIQIGGLGFLTILTMFSMFFHRRIGLRERGLLQESVNTMYIGGIVKLMKKILIGTFAVESAGAVLLAVRFIPEMGVAAGIYNSVFTSISAFCNAGFDLMGRYGEYSSLTRFRDDTVVNITIILLILIGGIGFFVWDDITVNKLKFSKYKLHTKLVLISTAALVVSGTLFFFMTESNTVLEGLGIGSKIKASAFMAVTPRTAGFNTTDIASMSSSGKLLTIILMFIGGNPGSTAGGVKTTTVIIFLLSAWSSLKNRSEINIMKRRLESDVLKRAASVITINITLIIVSMLLISAAQPELDLPDLAIEIFSAIDTVGMTTGITRELNTFSRYIVIFLMYCGRVGSLSFALLFTEQKTPDSLLNPVEKINIG